MRKHVEILVIGGGIAGISAAARIAQHAETIVLEGESALGYHSSGRSATFYHFGIGNDAVRGMTAASSSFFAAPPPDFFLRGSNPANRIELGAAALEKGLLKSIWSGHRSNPATGS